MDEVRALGCIACRIEMVTFLRALGGPVEIHHLLSGNKRLGHGAILPLCRWHHRGEPAGERTKTCMAQMLGPSLALQSKAFRAKYGTEKELIGLVNKKLARRESCEQETVERSTEESPSRTGDDAV